MIGTTVGNFRMVERLGAGGMGTVYRAVDEMLDREVAIKVLKPELARQAALLERFRQEAIALARLNHPRITALHGLERHGEDLLMIMEYVRGDTLEHIVERSGRLSWARAAELCVAILDALDHAHDKGVVHRDIKPANVMLSHKGAVKVMDFGIARMMGKNRQTQFGHSVGTPMYMSPEQLRGEEVDGRADLYATGAVLFELVTGRMAFEADSDYRLMMMQLNDPPPRPSTLASDVPREIDDIVTTAMSKKAADRFANAVVFRQALEKAIASHGPREGYGRRPISPPTRMAEDPTPNAHANASSPTAAPPPGATAEHTLRDPATVAETRLAEPQLQAPRYGRIPLPVETRLAGEAPGAGAPMAARDVHAHPSYGGPPDASHTAQLPVWATDWRRWAGGAAVLVVASLGVRAWRGVPSVEPASDSVAVVLPGPAPAATPLPGSLGDTTQPAQVASGAGTEQPYLPPPLPEPPLIITPRIDPGPPSFVVPVRPPERVRAERKRSPASRSDSSRADREVAKAQPPAEPPAKVEAPAARTERSVNAESAREEIAVVVEQIGRISAGRLQGIIRGDGAIQDKMIELLKAGRLSIAPQRGASIEVTDARATATFDAVVNVRSPFGANRRSSSRFVAQLQRDGDRWDVTSLRPIGAIDLK